jgi:hypothetical protein
MDNNTITIVSGLPRSGTSMMMKMLDEGGLPVLVDNIRTADEDNPKGYYEYEPVKKTSHDALWLEDARGKVVKMISALLKHLPADHEYKIIFMQRNLDEVLASQHQMLVRRGEPTDKVSDDKMATMFVDHLDKVSEWLAEQPNMDVIFVSYNDTLAAPKENAHRVNEFLGNILDESKMVGVVDQMLYRQRR